jgi:hypothetical protein
MATNLATAIHNPAQREKLRQRLLSYPGATPDSVENLIDIYERRAEEKADLVRGGNVWNALAEHHLDRRGYPRPPGWGPIFFYPDSYRLRNWYVFFGILALIAAWMAGVIG